MGGYVSGNDAKLLIADDIIDASVEMSVVNSVSPRDLQAIPTGDITVEGKFEVTDGDLSILNSPNPNPLNRKARRKEAALVRRMMKK